MSVLVELAIWMLALLCLAYVWALGWLGRGLRRAQSAAPETAPVTPSAGPAQTPSVTIIVCARNEERHLSNLLDALRRQNYPTDKLEICLVDDRSSDGTSAMMAAFAAGHAHARHFRIGDTRVEFAPKKRAIDFAIRRSRGEIILLTDADATPGPEWVREMVQLFTPEVVMACGYSPYFPRANLWQKILALEYFSLAAVAAGSIGAGRPLTCTGSNMAYRRSAYVAIDGFSGIAHYVSGDDDLFLHKMHRHGRGAIRYAGHPAAQVPVRPPDSWQDFKAQRTRYASKGRYYQPGVMLALVAVYGLNLLLCLGVLSLLAGRWQVFGFTLMCGLIKACSELAYLRAAAAWFGERPLLRSFAPAALLHPFYIVHFATRAQFATFHWRGQRFAAHTAVATKPAAD